MTVKHVTSGAEPFWPPSFEQSWYKVPLDDATYKALGLVGS